jgi:type IV secretion system protein VirB9
MKRYWLLFLLLLIGGPLSAQVRPVAGSGDPRLQTIDYNPDQIVQLGVASGYQLMVSFAPGERVETIAVGDSSAWQVTTNKRGDFLLRL